ncbi:MAG: acyl-CoA synthetase FdrA [Oscillospiraceae bacterium]|nr:acyl-CoA synthetase FdrA [Oscillospiraceae bacterium]
MADLICVRQNAYYDSVTLMTLSNKLKKMEGVQDAVVSMATDMNKELLAGINLSNSEVEAAGANDLLIAVRADSEELCQQVSEQVDVLLAANGKGGKKKTEQTFRTIAQAKAAEPELNLAVISVAGKYAAREARQALKNDMHVMLFSDNVTVEQEKELKEMAHEKGLLVMGPDCGTAILNGVGLCFANQVRRGDIGMVGASGTGLQEITVLVDRLGGGVSQAIGTGGRDLSADIGGRMMLDGIELLDADEATRVIVLISKPPVKEVAEKVLARVAQCKKPVVVCFIGAAGGEDVLGAVFAKSLDDAARKAVALSKGQPLEEEAPFEAPAALAEAVKALKPEQKYIRGLYCGGTLASEALYEIAKVKTPVYSNVAKKPEQKMKDLAVSEANTIIDLGDDAFTVGRPHPMIEPELRNDRLLAEALDPETAVVLLDFELGYGSHEDPAGVALEAIRAAQEKNRAAGREVLFVGYILGTDSDFQNYAAQRAALEEAGVLVAGSNLDAVRMALAAVNGR